MSVSLQPSSPQSSSSELSRQSFRPLQRSCSGIQMWFRQVQSDSKQPWVEGQFSSSEPVGHWICPSQRAEVLTHPTESTQGNWPGGHSEEPESNGGNNLTFTSDLCFWSPWNTLNVAACVFLNLTLSITQTHVKRITMVDKMKPSIFILVYLVVRCILTSAVHFIRSILTISRSVTSPNISDTLSIITQPLALKASLHLTYKYTQRGTEITFHISLYIIYISHIVRDSLAW